MSDPAQHRDQFLEWENTRQGGGTPQKPPLDTDSVDPQWLDILPVGMALSRTKIRAQLPRKPLPEGIEPGHVIGIVEDEEPLVVVQEDAHLLQLALDVKPRPGLGAGAVLVPIVHHDAVEPTAWLDLDAALAGHSLMGQANHPLGFFRHHHLPVVHASAKGLGAQHRHLHVKAPGRVLQRLRVQVAIGHNGAVV